MIDLTNIISALLALIAAVITTFLIPYIRNKAGETKFGEIKTWVQIAVSAAEMIYSGPGRGEEKKAYVLEFLASKGYTIDEESINAMIEAAVQQLNLTIGGK